MNRRQTRSPNPFKTLPPGQTGRLRVGARERDLFTGKRKHRFPFFWVVVICLLVVALSGLFNLVTNSMVQVETITVVVPGLDRAFEGYTLLHISDLHGARFGKNQAQLLGAFRQKGYQAVLITGDMVGSDGDPYPFYELLEGLGTQKPVYFIAGDEDPKAILSEPHPSNEVFADFIQGAQRRGAIYLDTPKRLQVGGKSLWITPESLFSLDIDAALTSYRNQLQKDLEGGNAGLDSVKARIRALRYWISTLEEAKEARAQITPQDMVIALSHYPLQDEFVRSINNWSVTAGGDSFTGTLDLLLAGHFNGGQVRLPLIGPLYVPNDSLPRSGWLAGDGRTQGLMQVGGILQHISPGLGVAGIYALPFRLFNPPKVTLLKLTGLM